MVCIRHRHVTRLGEWGLDYSLHHPCRCSSFYLLTSIPLYQCGPDTRRNHSHRSCCGHSVNRDHGWSSLTTPSCCSYPGPSNGLNDALFWLPLLGGFVIAFWPFAFADQPALNKDGKGHAVVTNTTRILGGGYPGGLAPTQLVTLAPTRPDSAELEATTGHAEEAERVVVDGREYRLLRTYASVARRALRAWMEPFMELSRRERRLEGRMCSLDSRSWRTRPS